jgi:hypothetical protein
VFNFPVYKKIEIFFFISPQLEWPYSWAITRNAGEDTAKLEPLYTVGGNEN